MICVTRSRWDGADRRDLGAHGRSSALRARKRVAGGRLCWFASSLPRCKLAHYSGARAWCTMSDCRRARQRASSAVAGRRRFVSGATRLVPTSACADAGDPCVGARSSCRVSCRRVRRCTSRMYWCTAPLPAVQVLEYPLQVSDADGAARARRGATSRMRDARFGVTWCRSSAECCSYGPTVVHVTRGVVQIVVASLHLGGERLHLGGTLHHLAGTSRSLGGRVEHLGGSVVHLGGKENHVPCWFATPRRCSARGRRRGLPPRLGRLQGRRRALSRPRASHPPRRLCTQGPRRQPSPQGKRSLGHRDANSPRSRSTKGVRRTRKGCSLPEARPRRARQGPSLGRQPCVSGTKARRCGEPPRRNTSSPRPRSLARRGRREQARRAEWLRRRSESLRAHGVTPPRRQTRKAGLGLQPHFCPPAAAAAGGLCFSHTNRCRNSLLRPKMSIQRLCTSDSCTSSGVTVSS